MVGLSDTAELVEVVQARDGIVLMLRMCVSSLYTFPPLNGGRKTPLQAAITPTCVTTGFKNSCITCYCKDIAHQFAA